MPGTPPTSPRFGAPRYTNGDGSDFAGQVNGVTDIFDALGGRFESGLLSARPSTGAGIANRFYFAFDNGRLYRDAGGATPTWSEVTPQAHAASHAAGGTDALTVTETMNATGANGLAKGSFSAYRNAALSVATGATLVFDTEEFDLSNWFNNSTGLYNPQVAGFYRVNWQAMFGTSVTADAYLRASLVRNGSLFKYGTPSWQRGTSVAPASSGTAMVQANGTTDTFGVVIEHGAGGSIAVQVASAGCYFQGHLVGRS